MGAKEQFHNFYLIKEGIYFAPGSFIISAKAAEQLTGRAQTLKPMLVS